ncbi:putative quinol monooxygenase [Dyella amyloliquefaciens]|uniref:putative quinol monooxygenase n=1 Tax=Dyella amyloliquefaciens TaxID=1770545 RepID=UPI00102EC4AB|nr:antibiotic biosynthesis monooxygenase [Dyella amyloliquefaciens]
MSNSPMVLINVLKAEPGKRDALVALLEHNIETVVRTLAGWRGSRLIASADGNSVVIHSEWESVAAVDAMRSDPRMTVYFPEILKLASIDSTLGVEVFGRYRSDVSFGLSTGDVAMELDA